MVFYADGPVFEHVRTLYEALLASVALVRSVVRVDETMAVQRRTTREGLAAEIATVRPNACNMESGLWLQPLAT